MNFRTHDYADAIRYVQNQGIVAGYPDGTYRPEDQINRAELIKIIVGYKFPVELINDCDTRQYVSFSDTDSSAWYAPFLCIAHSIGIVDGYSDGTFRPGNSVNFAEAAKIISMFDDGAVYSLHTNSAAQDGQSWYKPYIDYLINHSEIPKSIPTNQFDHLLRRGEMASIIYRLAVPKNASVHSSSVASNTILDAREFAWEFRLALEEGSSDILEVRDILAEQSYRFQIGDATCSISESRTGEKDGVAVIIKDVQCSNGLTVTQKASNSFMGTACGTNRYQTNLFTASNDGEVLAVFELNCTPPPNGGLLTHTDSTELFTLALPSSWLSYDAERGYPIERSLENGMYGPDGEYVMSIMAIRGPKPAGGWYQYLLNNFIDITHYNPSKETMSYTHNNYTRYDLFADTDAVPWQSYVILEKEGYIQEGRDGVIVLGFKSRNATTQAIIDSLKLL